MSLATLCPQGDDEGREICSPLSSYRLLFLLLCVVIFVSLIIGVLLCLVVFFLSSLCGHSAIMVNEMHTHFTFVNILAIDLNRQRNEKTTTQSHRKITENSKEENNQMVGSANVGPLWIA